MQSRRSIRLLALPIALVAAALLCAATSAPAATYKLHPVASHKGVYTFRVAKLKRRPLAKVTLRVGNSKRKISVNRVRKATRHRHAILRARAPRPSNNVRDAARHVTLVVSTKHGGSKTTTTTTSTSGQGDTSSGTNITIDPNALISGLPGHSCAPPFAAGNWPDSCWRPYAATSPFNRPISANAPVMANSGAIVHTVLGFGQMNNMVSSSDPDNEDWAHPTYYSQPSDPLFTLHCTETWGRCDFEGMQIHIPDAAKPASGGDGHMTVVDQSSGWEYDFWQVKSKPAGGGTLSASWGGRTRIDGDGLGSAGTAALFGNLAGLIRAPEIASGQINHALFMTVNCDSGQHVYPAGQSGRACSDIGISNANASSLGARFQLAMSDDQIDALNVPAWKKGVLRAMAHYGMYVGDTGGGTWGVAMESAATYTRMGVANPLAAWAKQAGVPQWNGDFVFNVRDGVDWARYLRVLDPCTANGTC